VRRSSVLGVYLVAVLIVGAVPASAKSVIVLKTTQGGVAPAGAPVRLSLSVRADIGPFCYQDVIGSIAVNGKPRDKVTFPSVEFARECTEGGETAAFAGQVSALEISKSGSRLTASLKDTVTPGPCLYTFPARVAFVEGPPIGQKEVSVRRVGGPKNECPQGFGFMSFELTDPQSGEYFYAEKVPGR
jgi:hypothetical protein